ncbi:MULTISPECIES: hypothetical protein [Cryobacterium]|uniref:Uncharacterized protein n=2 Tax=Cryobacterium TaxID=69578 RepID=A0A4R9AUX9_9MICO|nr:MULTISPECIES: hypothetical protein [Cryobacterium]TFD64142.1 hypothetical protein E3T47_11555 [Cryobacterium ruanii]TFD70653.1 hypothetical protein E3T50_08655 [Cryobacterium gelidum]
MSETAVPVETDATSDTIARLLGAAFAVVMVLIALPLVVPVVVSRLAGDVIATKTRFWVVWRWQWTVNTVGILLVAALLTWEAILLADWIRSGAATEFFDDAEWWAQLWSMFGPWVVANFFAGVLLLPAAWSLRRRKIAEQVRSRRVSNVVRQEKIETARKRAADSSVARRIGVRLEAETGRIVGTTRQAVTVPLAVGDQRQAFGVTSRVTIRTLADRFYDMRRVRDWVDATGKYLVLPPTASSVRALIIAESGSGKTVLINGLVLCALEYGWPVFVIDAKGDPADAENLVAVAQTYGRTATTGGTWNLFNGTGDQITAKLMRLMPVPDGANQHYLDEIRGVLQMVQGRSPLSSIDDLRERLTYPARFVDDTDDLPLINKRVERDGSTAGARALQSLLVALRPMQRWIGQDGWSYNAPKADVTVIPLSPVDDAQARLGDLLLLDLRNFLATRLERRDKSPVVVIVDEFPQLVTGSQDPGDTAGSLFETARSAGVGLVLATQSPAGLSNDEVRRRRALTSGAALIFGRSKDPEDVVKYAGTVMRMESAGRATGEELGSARAQHTYVIPPQDVREAADGAFWIVQGGAIAPFRALPNRQLQTPPSAPLTPVPAPAPADVERGRDAEVVRLDVVETDESGSAA